MVAHFIATLYLEFIKGESQKIRFLYPSEQAVKEETLKFYILIWAMLEVEGMKLQWTTKQGKCRDVKKIKVSEQMWKVQESNQRVWHAYLYLCAFHVLKTKG